MMKIASLSALLLGIVLDIQGCGGGCTSHDAQPKKTEDCTSASIAACMQVAPLHSGVDIADMMGEMSEKDMCKVGEATYCCFANCCSADASIMPDMGMGTMTGTVKEAMTVMKALMKAAPADENTCGSISLPC